MADTGLGTNDNDGRLLSAIDGVLLNCSVELEEAFIDGSAELLNDGTSDGTDDTKSDGACVTNTGLGTNDNDGKLL